MSDEAARIATDLRKIGWDDDALAVEAMSALIEHQAARIAELEIAAEIMKGNWQEGAVSL